MKPTILEISTRYGHAGWVVYRGENNLFDCVFYSTREAAENSLK